MLLLFDFDGTLADSSPGIYASFELACTRLNLKPPGLQAFTNAIGPPVQRLAQSFFPDLSKEELEAFRQIFRNDYDHYRFRQCDWYEGTKSTIAALGVMPGLRLAIVTNKPTKPTISLLKEAGIFDWFQLVIGIDYQVCQGSGQIFTTKAEAIQLAYSHLSQGDASAAVYIGDTPSDREASHACGLQFIAATYGFHRWQGNELLAIKSINNFSQLISLLHDMLTKGQS